MDNFTKDFIKVYDEIKKPSDIESFWHVSKELATDLFNVCLEYLEQEQSEESYDIEEINYESSEAEEIESEEDSVESSSDNDEVDCEF